MRIFVIQPEERNLFCGNYAPACLIELPSGDIRNLPEDIQKMANSKCPLFGRRVRTWLNKTFGLASKEPIWIVWEGRAIQL